MDDKHLTIVTHSGAFHPDDIFAVATLCLVLESDHKIFVVRTRDQDIIKKADYVVDVGGIYDPALCRFDHHQVGGAGVRANSVEYASFGLVWKEFGERLSGSKEIAERMDLIVVQPIDSLDNGDQFVEPTIKGLYPYDMGMLFDAFKPTWKETGVDKDKVFLEMVDLAKKVISREIIKKRDKLEAHSLVEEAYKKAPDKRLIELVTHLPYNDVLSEYPEPLFVICPRDDEFWMIQTVKSDAFRFTSRKLLPESWAGKNFEDLEVTSGIIGAVFCHRDRFIAVAKTKEAILKMAELALRE